MLPRLRENGPVVLVPLAWTFTAAAHLDVVQPRTVLIAHLVMDVIIAAFTVLSWRDMTDSVLLAWRRVLVVGLGITLAGTAGLLATPQIEPLLTGTVIGWMVVPGVALLYTGQHVTRRPLAYTIGGMQSLVGAVAYAVGVFGSAEALVYVGLVFAGFGQTLGIAAAVYDH
jgi:hypothetical protein